MISSIISAVSTAVNAEFGDGYAVYDEAVEQGLEEPCFFVQCPYSTLSRQIGDHFYKENLICIQYFPADRLYPVKECRDAAERLMLCLEYVTVDGEPLRGVKMNYKISDGMLSFFVNYNTFVRKGEADNKPRMKKLIQEINL